MLTGQQRADWDENAAIRCEVAGEKLQVHVTWGNLDGVFEYPFHLDSVADTERMLKNRPEIVAHFLMQMDAPMGGTITEPLCEACGLAPLFSEPMKTEEGLQLQEITEDDRKDYEPSADVD